MRCILGPATALAAGAAPGRRSAGKKYPPRPSKAITATSQREGIVLLGKDGQPLTGLPNIDHRGREWENIMEDKSRIYQLTGRYPTSCSPP